MVFFIILAGGLIGAFSAVKGRVYSNWIFLISTLFSAFFSLLSAPVFTRFLSGVEGMGTQIKNCAVIIALFIILEIVFNKLFLLVLGEEFDYADFPAVQEKIGNFICGLLSGMMILSIIIFCAVMVLPLKSFLKEKEADSCMAEARSAVSRIISAGDIITMTMPSSKQFKLVEDLLVQRDPKKPEAKTSARTENSKTQKKKQSPK